MPENCPHLEYRPLSDADESASEGGDSDADPRAYCTAADEFVQPMRADVCNDRYDLDHETDCEIFRDHEGLPAVPESDGCATTTEDETAAAAEEDPDR